MTEERALVQLIRDNIEISSTMVLNQARIKEIWIEQNNCLKEILNKLAKNTSYYKIMNDKQDWFVEIIKLVKQLYIGDSHDLMGITKKIKKLDNEIDIPSLVKDINNLLIAENYAFMKLVKSTRSLIKFIKTAAISIIVIGGIIGGIIAINKYFPRGKIVKGTVIETQRDIEEQ